MKTKIFLFASLTALIFALNALAYETWHTASGAAYEVHLSLTVGQTRANSKFYAISYKTEKNLDNTLDLLPEYYDLLAHLYYFHIPKEIKNDPYSVVTIEAFEEKTRSRRYSRKLSDVKRIVENYKNIDGNRLKAFQNFNQKKYEQAIAFFKKVKKRVPHDYSQTANAYILLGKRDDAFKELEAGIKKYPRDLTLLNNLAMTTLLKGTYLLEGKYAYDPEQMERAKQILSKALKLDPTHWATVANMAVLEMTLQNTKAAEKLYLDALRLSPENAELSYRVGNFYHKQKEFKKAGEYYQAALQKLKNTRSPASEHQTKAIQDRLKLVKKQKLP